MSTERITLPFEAPGIDGLSAAVHEASATAAARASAVLLANGAGFHLDSPWMLSVARGLAQRGFAVLQFNYAYRERALREGKRNRPPDAPARLEAAHATALAALQARYPERRLLLAGKSLGGRIGTHLAAKGEPCAGVVLLGYPLHPPGKPDKRRDEHFAAIAQPALFLQGTRDALCDLDLLRESLGRFGGQTTLEVIEDADHSFHVRKTVAQRSDEQVLEYLLDRVARWDQETFPN